jgi:hypothetical protein
MNELTQKIRDLLNTGMRQCDIAKHLSVSRDVVRYHSDEHRRQYLMAKSNAEKKQRRTLRMGILRQEAGGKCSNCGYNRCPAALHFHHKNPTQKEFHISQYTGRYSMERLRAEARKCKLLCANCHIELTHPIK